MREGLRIFLLLFRKNNIVRARHYILTAFEILIPILSFAFFCNIRELLVVPSVPISDSTYHPIETRNKLVAMINTQATNVYFVPMNNVTTTMMEKARVCLSLPVERVTGFSSVEKMLEAYTFLQTEDPHSDVLAVVFDIDQADALPQKLKYTIQTTQNLPSLPSFSSLSLGSVQYILNTPFAQLQMCVDSSFIELAAPDPPYDVQMSIQQMPSPPHDFADVTDDLLRQMLSTVALFSLLATFVIEPTFPAKEKQIGVNILMAMNGVRTYQNLLSWLLSGVVVCTIYVSVVTGLFKMNFSPDINPFLFYGNGFIFWLMLVINAAHFISFGLHIAAYFTKPHFAQGALVFVLFIASTVDNMLTMMKSYSAVPYLSIFLPNMALRRMLDEVSVYEQKLIGIQWYNMFSVGDLSQPRLSNIGAILILSVLGTVLHFLLAVYVTAIFPGKYGVSEDPLFFLKCSKKNKVNIDDDTTDFEDVEDRKQFETVPDGIFTPGIQIRKLTKVYSSVLKRTSMEAIKGITLDIYKGQVTALLGHNGAGKTTIMSILTGLTSPTEGTALLNGRDVKKELHKVRNDVGVCPQENMYFPDLTVFQQLMFFGRLKRRNESRKQITERVHSLLTKLGMYEKRNAMPDNLSGGQKRRLCLGMALIGDASILILDEPTSGLDLESKREVCDIVLKLRGEKTIIISTHSMEEADILSDRIVIMHRGKIHSYGTSMFLKKLYGHGRQEVTLSTEPWCDLEKIHNIVGQDVEIHNVDSGRVILSMPYTNALPKIFDNLESQKKKLGITGMSVSITTLEQVFLKVIKEEEEGAAVDQNDSLIPPASMLKLSGTKLTVQMVLALLKKKYTYARKNLLISILTLIIPLVGVVLMANIDSISINSKIITTPLRLDVYGYTRALYSAENDDLRAAFKETVELLHGSAELVEPPLSVSRALLNGAEQDIASYNNEFVVAAEFNSSAGTVLSNGLYSGLADLSIPIAINLLSNTIVKSLAGNEYWIDVSSQALPKTLASTQMNVIASLTEATLKIVLFNVYFFIIIGFFLIQPFHESATGVKQLQRMTGVNSFLYWVTTFVFDFAIISISIGFVLVALYIADVVVDIRIYRETEIGLTALLLILFAVNSLLVVYIFSFIKKSLNVAITILSLVPTIFVVQEIIFFWVFKNLQDNKVLQMVGDIQRKIFFVIPHVSFSFGHMFFLHTAAQNARCRRMPERLLNAACLGDDTCCGMECSNGVCLKPLSYLNNFEEDSSCEEALIYLSVTPILLIIILYMLEHKIFLKLAARFHRAPSKVCIKDMNPDVAKEKKAVASSINKRRINGMEQRNGYSGNAENSVLDSADGDVFLVYELSKNYGTLSAVKEISFRVKKGECFGLLGVNGAGKSTAFRMLTGGEIPSSGTMILGEHDISTNPGAYLAQMGYCPQTNAIIRSLNAWDHLELFARLRGVPKSEVNLEVQNWINKLKLSACAKRPAGTYSGGNKRRLNVAMALIGRPNIVLLDEPTTGVDPAARRSLWNVLRACQNEGQAIILTSHSMDECEVLCNRLVIMVRGELVCVGASQELKQRHGTGYDINVKLHPERTDAEAESIKADIEAALNLELRDENTGLLLYHVIDSNTTWVKMFETMNALKHKYNCIEDFSVSSSTLEQLFMQFAKDAKKPKYGETSGQQVEQPVMV